MKPDKATRATGLHHAAERVRVAQARVHETAAERGRRGGVERWHAALAELNQAMRELHPPSMEDDARRLRVGDPDAIESAITYLENDPFAFGTGYVKEEMLRRLRHVALTPKQKARLAGVILHQVDNHDRREFWQYCLIGPLVVDDSLRLSLLGRLRSGEPGRARRALRVLDLLGEAMEPRDHAIARGIIEAIAASRFWWRASNWLRPAVTRHGDPAWIEDLVDRASSPGKAGEAALFLLTIAGRRLTSEQRRRLDSRAAAIAASITGFDGEAGSDHETGRWRWAAADPEVAAEADDLL